MEEKLRPEFEGYVQKHSIQDYNGEDPDIDTLIGGAVKRLDEFGESSELYEVWEQHKEEFLKIAEGEASEEFKLLEQKEHELVQRSRELREALYERKVNLRKRYGISSREIEDARTDEIDDITP